MIRDANSHVTLRLSASVARVNPIRKYVSGAFLLCMCWLSASAADCPAPLQCPATASCADPRSKPNRVSPNADKPVAKANIAEHLPNSDVTTFRGDVEVRQGDRVLRAQEVEYNEATSDFRVPGAVELFDPNLTLSGDGAKADTAGAAQFDNTTFAIPARAGHGSAGQIRLATDGAIDLSDTTYTTCPASKPDWELKISHLHVDQQAQVATGTGIRVDFKGVPIFYTPYISIPVGNEPKSGLLFPDFGLSARSGWKFSFPWYWRIADNADATFVPSVYTTRGIDAGGEFRFLTESSKGQLNANFLANDRVTGTDRTMVELHEQTDISPRLRFSADGINIGDRAWFEDFGGATYISTVALPRSAELVYRADEWSVLARTQNFQIIDPEIAPVDRPYTTLPEILLRGYFPDRLFGLTRTLDQFATSRHYSRDPFAAARQRILLGAGGRD
jgi:LPS-assembly protein